QHLPPDGLGPAPPHAYLGHAHSVERSLGEEEDGGAGRRVGEHALDQTEPGREGEHEQDEPAPHHCDHALDPLLARLRLLRVLRPGLLAVHVDRVLEHGDHETALAVMLAAPADPIEELRRQQGVGLEEPGQPVVGGVFTVLHLSLPYPPIYYLRARKIAAISYSCALDAPGADAFRGASAPGGIRGRLTSAIVVLSNNSMTRRCPSRHTRSIPHVPSSEQSAGSAVHTLSEMGPSTASITSRKVICSAGRAMTQPPCGPRRERTSPLWISSWTIFSRNCRGTRSRSAISPSEQARALASSFARWITARSA